MNSRSKFRKNPDVVARLLAEGEGGVLLHLGTGAYHGMNEIGLMIWELIDGERTARPFRLRCARASMAAVSRSSTVMSSCF